MLRVKKREQGEVVVLELAGRIDGSDSCHQIHEAFRSSLEGGILRFVIDLTDVDWVNSLGVGFLVAAAVSASREGATVRLTGLGERVGTVLRATGVVPHVWKDFADEASAVASFG